MTVSRRTGRGPTRRRLLVGAAAGAAVGLAVGIPLGWRYGLLTGWMMAAASFVTWTWIVVWPMGPPTTQRHALREDPGSALIDLTVLIAAIASLIAVALVLAGSGNKDVQAGLAVGSVALSWAAVHTVYTIRYARLYYTQPVGGISFNQPDPPRYGDFAYFSFTVGMTFQVSDTNIEKTSIRVATLHHALLSYLFGAVILAAAINLVAGLGK